MAEDTNRDGMQALEERIAALSPWDWPERLAVSGLGALLAGVVLPWGREPAGVSRQLVEHEHAGWLGVCLVVLAVAVPAGLTASQWGGVAAGVTGLAAALAVPLTLLVSQQAGDSLPLLVPGRVAITAGAVCLLVAVTGRARARVSWHRSGLSASSPVPLTDEVRFERSVAGLRASAGGSALGGTALAMVVAGTVTVLGPWWFGPTPAPLSGAVRASRSGIDELGGVRSAVVAVSVVLAAAAFVRLGGRRGAPVVVATGVLVMGVLVSGAVGVPAGRTVVPLVGAVAAAAGLFAAIVVLWPSWRSRAWMPALESPPTDVAELAAAVEHRARWDADRWIALAGLGLAVIAVSTQLYWRTGPIPIGPLGRGSGSVLLCIGLAAGVVPLVVAKLRPWTSIIAAGGLALTAAAELVVVAWFKLMAVDVGSATLLALLGAFATAAAAAAPLRGLEDAPPTARGRPMANPSPWFGGILLGGRG